MPFTVPYVGGRRGNALDTSISSDREERSVDDKTIVHFSLQERHFGLQELRQDRTKIEEMDKLRSSRLKKLSSFAAVSRLLHNSGAARALTPASQV